MGWLYLIIFYNKTFYIQSIVTTTLIKSVHTANCHPSEFLFLSFVPLFVFCLKFNTQNYYSLACHLNIILKFFIYFKRLKAI